jgi:hypothetical protein
VGLPTMAKSLEWRRGEEEGRQADSLAPGRTSVKAPRDFQKSRQRRLRQQLSLFLSDAGAGSQSSRRRIQLTTDSSGEYGIGSYAGKYSSVARRPRRPRLYLASRHHGSRRTGRRRRRRRRRRVVVVGREAVAVAVAVATATAATATATATSRAAGKSSSACGTVSQGSSCVSRRLECARASLRAAPQERMPIRALGQEMEASVVVSSLPRVKTARTQQQRLRRHSLLAALEVEHPGAVAARSAIWFKHYKGYYDVRKLQEDSVSWARAAPRRHPGDSQPRSHPVIT